MQEVLLQLTAGSAFRPKRPAIASAAREQDGPNAALHDLMESCWHQVRPAERPRLDLPQPASHALCPVESKPPALSDALHDLRDRW